MICIHAISFLESYYLVFTSRILLSALIFVAYLTPLLMAESKPPLIKKEAVVKKETVHDKQKKENNKTDGRKNKEKPNTSSEAAQKPSTNTLFEVKKDEVTTITSQSLSIDSNKKVFTYTGDVKVVQGDLVMTCAVLDGYYDDQNKIKELVAKKSVVITKPPTTKATGEKAVYNAIKRTIALTENPQLYQGENILSAEKINIYIDENRSTAEGQVRVKLVSDKEGADKNGIGDVLKP
jgi:lipopolysaccharide export system protein LptA